MIVLLELATVGKFLNKKLTYFFDRLNRAMIGRVRTNRQGKISILINIFFTIGFKFKLKKGDPCGVSCAASSPRKNTFRSGGKNFSTFKIQKI